MKLGSLGDGNGGFDVRKMCYVIVLIAAGLAVGVSLLSPTLGGLGDNPKAWDDVHNYFLQWMQMAGGKVPYRDFVFEYPPLAIPIMALPGLFCFGNEDLYGILFTVFSAVATVIGYIYIVKLGRNIGLGNRVITILFLLCTFLLPRYFLRLETFMMMFVILGFYLYSEKRYTAAFSMMALGTMLKLVPAIFAVAMALPFLLRRRWTELAKYIGICAAICLALTMPFLIIDSGSAFDYLTYHGDRGLQIESVAASVILLFNMFVPFVGLEQSYGSANLTGAVPDAVASVIMYVMVAAMVLFIILSARRHKGELTSEDNTRRVIFIGLISMTIFIALNKVFSAQYIIWVIPLVALVLHDRDNRGIGKDVLYLSIICTAVTILPSYPMLTEFNPLAVILLLIRNVAFCALLVRLIQMMAGEIAPSGATPSC